MKQASIATLDEVRASVLPPGLSVREGEAPPAPTDFEDGFVLPAHTEKPLQAAHTHHHDAALAFFEEPHIYTVGGVPTTASVTGLAHEFEKPFVAADAIAAMKRGRNQAWPRLKSTSRP